MLIILLSILICLLFISLCVLFFFLIKTIQKNRDVEENRLQKIILLEKENSSLNTELEMQRAEYEKKEEAFLKLKNEMNIEFANLSNKIFIEHNKTFVSSTESKINNLLNPLKENILNFQREINSKHISEEKSRIELKVQIEQLILAQSTLSQGAENLTNALRGENKTQGNWGEMILENILIHSGLTEGIDFVREGKGLELKQNEKNFKPDVIVNLPENKSLIIDSKVSLVSYERYSTGKGNGNSGDRSVSEDLKQFLHSVKQHIRGLSEKKYYHLEKLITPEFVLLFIPIEGAFSLSLQNDNQLFEFAWKKKIILVSPSTLLATLKTVASVWKFEKQQKNALKIAGQAGKLYDKFYGFVENLNDVKKNFQKSEESLDKAFSKLNTGRGNLISHVEKLKELGAKTSKQLEQD